MVIIRHFISFIEQFSYFHIKPTFKFFHDNCVTILLYFTFPYTKYKHCIYGPIQSVRWRLISGYLTSLSGARLVTSKSVLISKAIPSIAQYGQPSPTCLVRCSHVSEHSAGAGLCPAVPRRGVTATHRRRRSCSRGARESAGSRETNWQRKLYFSAFCV